MTRKILQEAAAVRVCTAVTCVVGYMLFCKEQSVSTR